MKRGDAFESTYLSAKDLKDKGPVRVTIAKVTMETVGQGKDAERLAVVSFVGKQKRFILNKTNWNRLEDVCQSDDSDNWTGWTVTLFVTKVDFQGQRVDAIRVDDEPGHTFRPGSPQQVQAPQAPPPADPSGPASYPTHADLQAQFERLREIAAKQGGSLGDYPNPFKPQGEQQWKPANENVPPAIDSDDIPF